jgi:predicted ATP-dependent endonuclease of OLD family
VDPVQDAERFNFRFDLFDSCEFFKAIRLAFSEADSIVDATRMGHGAQNALIVAIFQAYERMRKRGALILLEEPELYLHPHRRRFFYSTLRKVSERNQIIYTTHSSHFVAVPEYEEVQIVYRDTSHTTKVRTSTMKPTPALREKMRKELDPERNELFFAKHVVFVEGDTEKPAIPEYARRLGINLDRLDVSVIEVGGKRSLKTFVEILRSFDIPIGRIVWTSGATQETEDVLCRP